MHGVRHHLPDTRQHRQTVLHADEDNIDHRVDKIEDEAERDAEAFARLTQEAAPWNQPAVQHILDAPRDMTGEVPNHLETLKHSSQRLQPALHNVHSSTGCTGDSLAGCEEREKGKVPVFDQSGSAQHDQRVVEGRTHAGQDAKQPAERPDDQVEQQAAGVQTSSNSKNDNVHSIHIRLQRREMELDLHQSTWIIYAGQKYI